MRKYRICITHLYLGKLPNASPESVLYDHSALSLANCLQNNDFRIQMDVPNIRRVPSHLDWRQWVDAMFNEVMYQIPHSCANMGILCWRRGTIQIVGCMSLYITTSICACDLLTTGVTVWCSSPLPLPPPLPPPPPPSPPPLSLSHPILFILPQREISKEGLQFKILKTQIYSLTA